MACADRRKQRSAPVASTNVLEINAERLWDSLERSAEIGRFRDVGLRRLALSSEDKGRCATFSHLGSRGRAAMVEIDRLGNIFARRAGSDPSLPPVAIGSHLDTRDLRRPLRRHPWVCWIGRGRAHVERSRPHPPSAASR